ncbi:flavin reductase family protein [Candidatus Thorarchaeota archaeon]|nr:MAG: flavin reductase family protein [Candidatus Thorarchaeota archaeon]
MSKIKLDQRFSPYQMPSVIIGTIVEGKPNFMLCTWVSRVNRTPPIWMASINRKHLTMNAIRENGNFSMNFPSSDLVEVTDYVGITSGRDADKSSLFNIFYGETNAPMIEECVLNMELEEMVERPDHFIVLAKSINTYADQKIMTDDKPDIKKMNQIVYTGAEGRPTYWVVGDKIGDAFSLGKSFKETMTTK